MALCRYGNAKLAHEIGYSAQRTSRLLNGYENVPVKFMDAVSETLGLPVEELFRPEGHHGR
jgi:hypothetical protein